MQQLSNSEGNYLKKALSHDNDFISSQQMFKKSTFSYHISIKRTVKISKPNVCNQAGKPKNCTRQRHIFVISCYIYIMCGPSARANVKSRVSTLHDM
jgi:hypothetical protein